MWLFKTKKKALDLPKPKTNQEEILYTLIDQGYVSIMDFPYLSGFRTRISDIKTIHNLTLNKESILTKNKFGNPYHYAVHKLPESEKQFAIELYRKLNSIKNGR